jgi:membrane protein implicated in regulation of membrane protease activity
METLLFAAQLAMAALVGLLVMAALAAGITVLMVMLVRDFFSREEYEELPKTQQDMREILKRADQETAGNEEK